MSRKPNPIRRRTGIATFVSCLYKLRRAFAPCWEQPKTQRDPNSQHDSIRPQRPADYYFFAGVGVPFGGCFAGGCGLGAAGCGLGAAGLACGCGLGAAALACGCGLGAGALACGCGLGAGALACGCGVGAGALTCGCGLGVDTGGRFGVAVCFTCGVGLGIDAGAGFGVAKFVG